VYVYKNPYSMGLWEMAATGTRCALAAAKGSLKNNFPFFHLGFGPSSVAAQSRQPNLTQI
jgi:hypothetical protein